LNIKGWDYEKQKNTTISFGSDALILNGVGEKGKLIQALFEPKTQLSDSVTYDITSWSLPYAYGLKAVASQQKVSNTIPFKEESIVTPPETNAYAYATGWRSYKDGKFLAALLKEKIRVRYNLKPLVNGGKRWAEGSLFILKGENKIIEEFDEKIRNLAVENNQTLIPLASGFSDAGIDLGSNLMEFIPQKRVGLIKSDNSNPQGYGEIWHFFEQQLKYPITQINLNRLNDRNLDKFDVLILPPGGYNLFSDDDSGLLKWIQKGGRLVALGSAIRAFANQNAFNLKTKSMDDKPDKFVPYAELERNDISSAIYGSIYSVNIDTTHPLAFGYDKNYFSLKNSATSYQLLSEGTVGNLPKESKPLAGFSGSEAIKRQSESLIFGMENLGSGSVIYIVDNPLYRGFWENGKLWIINAVFH